MFRRRSKATATAVADVAPDKENQARANAAPLARAKQGLKAARAEPVEPSPRSTTPRRTPVPESRTGSPRATVGEGAGTPPAAAAAESVTPSVPASDAGDHVLLDDWSFAFNASRPLQLTGRVFNNAAGFEDGDTLEYTSQIVEVKGRIATTKSGTTYYLGRPAQGFEQLRKQLWLCSRSGQLGRDDGSSVPPCDVDRPLAGIKLGQVVPCAPVRLPKMPGWSHQSGVAVRPRRTAPALHRASSLLLSPAASCRLLRPPAASRCLPRSRGTLPLRPPPHPSARVTPMVQGGWGAETAATGASHALCPLHPYLDRLRMAPAQ